MVQLEHDLQLCSIKPAWHRTVATWSAAPSDIPLSGSQINMADAFADDRGLQQGIKELVAARVANAYCHEQETRQVGDLNGCGATGADSRGVDTGELVRRKCRAFSLSTACWRGEAC